MTSPQPAVEPIDITGINKATLLAALYNHGNHATPASPRTHFMGVEDAQNLLDLRHQVQLHPAIGRNTALAANAHEPLRFDTDEPTALGFWPCRLKVNLAGNTLYPHGFDELRGAGSAARAVKALQDEGRIYPNAIEIASNRLGMELSRLSYIERQASAPSPAAGARKPPAHD